MKLAAPDIIEEDEGIEIVHTRGCSCRRTSCLKKYCVCYNSGLKCNENCRCSECLNGKDEVSLDMVELNESSINNNNNNIVPSKSNKTVSTPDALAALINLANAQKTN